MTKKSTTKAAATVVAAAIAAPNEVVVRVLSISDVIVAAVNALKVLEGVRDGNPTTPALDIYPDGAGIITIAYGHALFDEETKRPLYWSRREDRKQALSRYPDGVTQQEADAILAGDVMVRLASLRQDPSYLALNFGQQVAVLLFAFNVGVHTYRKSTLFRLIEAGQIESADSTFASLYNQMVRKTPILQVDEAFTAYSKQTLADGRKVIENGLFKRRYAEFLMFEGEPFDEALAAAEKALKQL